VKRKLSDFEGQYVYLNFWAHTCPPGCTFVFRDFAGFHGRG